MKETSDWFVRRRGRGSGEVLICSVEQPSVYSVRLFTTVLRDGGGGSSENSLEAVDMLPLRFMYVQHM